MTLSTEAEHAFGDEVDHVTSEAMGMVGVLGDVEDTLINAETRDGVSEARTAAVDIRSVTDHARETRRENVVSACRCFTDSQSVAEAAARDIFEHVEDLARHTVEKSPCLIDARDVDDLGGHLLLDESEVAL